MSDNDDYRYPHSLVSLPVLPNHHDKQSTAADTVHLEEPQAPATTPRDPTRFIEHKLLEGKVIEALRQVYDPEIPINIYELGLIYAITVNPDHTVHVKMTLTAPACPVAGSLPGEVERQIEAIPEVRSAEVELVWDPPWSRDRISEAALLRLGML